MSDWYDEGYRTYMSEIADHTNISVDTVIAIYGKLREDGMIDYDIEKDLFWEWYFCEEGEENVEDD